jgi:hypothetical protein
LKAWWRRSGYRSLGDHEKWKESLLVALWEGEEVSRILFVWGGRLHLETSPSQYVIASFSCQNLFVFYFMK